MDSGALFLLLLVIGMRPLLTETYDSSLHSVARAVGGLDTVTPARTALFGATIWLAAIAATLSSALRGVRWRWTGVEMGWVVLAIAAFISTLVTSNRRLATNASCDWLTTITILLLLANLCRNRLRVGLVLAVLTASGLTSAAKCFMQVHTEFADTRDWYNSEKEDFWERQNIPLDDPRVQLFERRMNANEATGFFPFSNTQGSWLSLAGFAALGCAALVRSVRLYWIVFAGLAVLLFCMIYTTGSKGALLACMAGLAVWMLLGRTHERLRARWRAVLIGGWVLVVLAIVAVIILGTLYGTLPGSSLAFRWGYWQVTRNIIAEHFWTGVGALNFDRAYLLLKPVESPEEIKDPHNFILAVLAQWGILGGIGLAAIFVGGSIRIAWTWAQGSEDRLYAVPEEMVRSSTPQWVATLVGGFLLLRVWLFREQWLSSDLGNQAAAFYDLGFYGLIWGISLTGILWIMGRANGESGKGYKLAALCGAGAFILHNTIDYASFYPGGLTPFIALTAMLMAGRQQRLTGRPTRLRPMLPTVLAACLALFYCAVYLVPVTIASVLLNEARQTAGIQPERAEKLLETAARMDPLDPTPLVELASIRARVLDPEHLSLALSAIDRAISRDPKDLSLYHMVARLNELRFRAGGSQADLIAALGAERRALEMYPNSPDEHIALADLLAMAAREFHLPDLAAEATEHYRAALELNDRRPGTDEVRRWPASRRQEIKDRIAQLAATTQPATTSAPATVPSSGAQN